MPATPRESMPIGVCWRDSARIASAMPGASRSITARVASGVTSSGVRPVPPVVKIEREAVVDVVVQAVLDQREVVGHDLHGLDVGAGLLGQLRPAAGRTRPRLARRATEVETVRTAVRIARRS